MSKTMSRQEWNEKIKSIEKSQTPKERYARALQIRADLEKAQHEDPQQTSLTCETTWGMYASLSSLVDAELRRQKAVIGMKEDKDALTEEHSPNEMKEKNLDLSEPAQEVEKIRWCDRNYQSLLALFELLHFAGYIDESDFRKTAVHVYRHFVKQDGTDISNQKAKAIRKSDIYNKKKEKIMDKIISQFADAIYDMKKDQPQT